MRGKKYEAGRGRRLSHGIQAGMHPQEDMRPVIQACPFQITVRQPKPNRFDEVKRRVSRGAGPRNVAGILRDFRLVQNDAQVRPVAAGCNSAGLPANSFQLLCLFLPIEWLGCNCRHARFQPDERRRILDRPGTGLAARHPTGVRIPPQCNPFHRIHAEIVHYNTELSRHKAGDARGEGSSA